MNRLTGADLRDGIAPWFPPEDLEYIEDMLAANGLSWEHVAYQARRELDRRVHEGMSLENRVITASAFGYVATLFDLTRRAMREAG